MQDVGAGRGCALALHDQPSNRARQAGCKRVSACGEHSGTGALAVLHVHACSSTLQHGRREEPERAQAHEGFTRSSEAELGALLEAHSSAEQGHGEEVTARTEEFHNAFHEQGTADAEEYKLLKSRCTCLCPAHAAKAAHGLGGPPFSAMQCMTCLWSRLEEQLHTLEAEAGVMHTTFQVNTEKLVYNCRVLAERALESAAALNQQKHRLSRQRDLLSSVKVTHNSLSRTRASRRRHILRLSYGVCAGSNSTWTQSARAQNRTCA